MESLDRVTTSITHLALPWERDRFLRSLVREIAGVLEEVVDLKRRIQGDFFVIAHDAEKIVLGNRACPFAEKVTGRPSMCMMTSNVFGAIAAENLGYAKVALQETIAPGHPGCRVIVYLQPTFEAEAQSGREYVKGDEEP